MSLPADARTIPAPLDLAHPPADLVRKLRSYLVAAGEHVHWTYGVSNGVPVVSWANSRFPVRKLIWSMQHGELPSRAVVRTTCSDGACCRIEHLVPTNLGPVDRRTVAVRDQEAAAVFPYPPPIPAEVPTPPAAQKPINLDDIAPAVAAAIAAQVEWSRDGQHLLWVGSRTEGTPTFEWADRVYSPRRLAWAMTYGAPSLRTKVFVTCGEDSCLATEHLDALAV